MIGSDQLQDFDFFLVLVFGQRLLLDEELQPLNFFLAEPFLLSLGSFEPLGLLDDFVVDKDPQQEADGGGDHHDVAEDVDERLA